MKEKCCAILGSPPMSFPWGYDEEDEGCAALKLLLLNRITVLRSGGVTEFAVVMDSGVGLYATEIINGLRETDTDMRLICIIPYEDQAAKWTPELRDRYFNEQAKCSEVIFTAHEKTAGCQILAMLNAVDMADTVIAVKSEADFLIPAALHYAERLGRTVFTFDAERMQYHA